MNTLESKMYLFNNEENNTKIIQIVCGGRIGFRVGANIENQATAVDVTELLENVGIGYNKEDVKDNPNTPTIRFVSDSLESYMVIINTFAKAFATLKFIKNNPNTTNEELDKVFNKNYVVDIKEI